MDITKACEILQINQKSSKEEAEKSYRRLAKLWHPDKYKGEDAQEKFTQIKCAVEYFIKFCDTDISDLGFSEAQPQPPPENPKPQQPLPNEIAVDLTLEEICNGCKKEIKIIMKEFSTKGALKSKSKNVKVLFPPGSIDGTRISVAREGDKYYGKIPADVVFVVRELAHKVFKRNRFDLEYTVTLSLEEACLGKFEVPTFDKVVLKFSTNDIISKNTVSRHENRGIPIPNSAGKRGDLVVRFNILCDKNKKQDDPIEHEIQLSLEQILSGYSKNYKFTRTIFSRKDTKYLTVSFPKGVKSDENIVFEMEGDQLSFETIPADIHFVVKEKPHAYFTRDGHDIKYTALISEHEFANGCTIEVPTLEREFIPLEMGRREKSKVIPSRGLPLRDNPSERGNLIVNFEITNEIDSPIENDFPVTLENILHGLTKKLKIKRKIIDRFNNETILEKIISIEIKPGTESDTKIVFPRLGDQYYDSVPADLVFIVCEKPHDKFKRNGENLEFTAKLTRRQMSNGCMLEIPTIDGAVERFSTDSISSPSAIKQFLSRGLPFSSDNTNKRGKLIVSFKIES